MQQYSGLKTSDENSDGAWLAHMLRLGLLPEGHIYRKQVRAPGAFRVRARFSFVGCAFLFAPFPFKRLSHSPSTISGSDFLQTFGPLLGVEFAYLPSTAVAFPRRLRLRPASLSGFPLLWLHIRLPCVRLPAHFR